MDWIMDFQSLILNGLGKSKSIKYISIKCIYGKFTRQMEYDLYITERKVNC